MKKLLALVLTVFLLMAIIPISTSSVSALDESSYLVAIAPTSDGEYWRGIRENTYVFYSDEDGANSSAYPNMEYSIQENTLTIDTIANPTYGPLCLEAYNMGEDFRIRVDGRASFANISVYDGSLEIIGNGELTVNQNKKMFGAIQISNGDGDGRLKVGKDVKMALYSNEFSSPISSRGSRIDNVEDAIQFENGQQVQVTKDPTCYFEYVKVKGIYMADPEEYRWYGWKATSATDFNPNHIYAYSEGEDDGGSPIVTLSKWICYARNGYTAYVVDRQFASEFNGDDYTFERIYTPDEWANQTEFTIPENFDDREEFEWYGTIVSGNFDVYENGDGNQYVKDYNGNVYVVSNDGEIFTDGTYYYLDPTTAVTSDELEEPKENMILVPGKYDYNLTVNPFIYGNMTPPADISMARVTGITDKSYSGKGRTQNITVTLNGKVLNKDFDYKVTYSNNKNVGTATMTITGMSAYTGTITKTFKITPKKITPTVTLSTSAYTYNGSAKKPTVTVKDGDTKLTTSDYSVTYATGRTNVGKYSVKVTLKGNYSGTKTVYFKINPKGTTISSLTKASKAFTVKWKKQATQTSGYQIQYSTSSAFASGNKTATVTKNTTVSKKISSLKAKKKYYVRIRTYKSVSGTKYYSSWSAKKYVTTK
jgi:hypothetical protein